jgi:hypothetical protein
LKEKWANKREVEELLISRIEVFTNSFRIVGGKREKFFDLRPVEKVAGSKNIHADGDLKIG